jgi:hypothetical protein
VIFPESATLLCVWHANKKIQQHCKARFTTSEDYNDFFKAWQEIGQSLDIPDYNSGLLLFLSEYSDTLGLIGKNRQFRLENCSIIL